MDWYDSDLPNTITQVRKQIHTDASCESQSSIFSLKFRIQSVPSEAEIVFYKILLSNFKFFNSYKVEQEPYEISEEAKQWLSNHNEPAIEILRRNAFRCVAQDNEVGLSEILSNIPTDVWCEWQNKGKQNIYDFAEIRKS